MDSRLLNAFHDETNNYIKFDSETNFWSPESESLGLQLTETLHGILPISPEEDSSHFFGNEMLREDELSSSLYGSNSTTQEDDAIEVITINPNNVHSDDEEEDDFERDLRSCSRSTFRSRTDSSSIADYESHSSDYDDDEDDLDEEFNLASTGNLIGAADHSLLVKDILPTDNLMPEEDAFDIDIDANTFDLAAFIIKDDMMVPDVDDSSTPNHIVIPQKKLDSDSDSDVDIETVEDDVTMPVVLEAVMPEPDPDDEVTLKEVEQPAVEEPIKQQPEQQQQPQQLPAPVVISKPKVNLVPNKRQREMLKGRGKGLGKGKGISMHKRTISPVKSCTKVINIPEKNMKNLEESAYSKKKLNLEEYKKRRDNPVITVPSKKIVVPSGEKLTFIKTQTSPDYIVSKVMEANSRSLLKPMEIASVKLDPITEAKNKVLRMQEMKKAKQIRILDSTVSAKVKKVTELPPLQDIINGGGDSSRQAKTKEVIHKNTDYEEIVIVSVSTNTEVTIPPIQQQKQQQGGNGGSQTSLLKTLNAKVVVPATTDLLQNVSSSILKVKTVTNSSLICSIQDVVVKKTVPGAPIGTILDTETESDKMKEGKDLEHGEDKIIMHLRKDRIRKKKITMSCQTEILPEFPPLPVPIRKTGHPTRKRRYRKRQSVHGGDGDDDEDDSGNDSRISRKKHRRHSRHSSSDQSSSYTSESSSGDAGSSGGTSSDSDNDHHRNREQNYNEYNRGYRCRSQSIESNNDGRFRNRRPNHIKPQLNHHNNNNSGSPGKPAVEERRIVYVGRIEEETTKEDLRRKFLSYGSIKQITIHYKDNGMKYGFVTYDNAQDAYKVIDSSQRDADINIYDISFGGRRAFCKASYADLDDAYMNSYSSYASYTSIAPAKKPPKDDSFEALLKQMKKKLSKS